MKDSETKIFDVIQSLSLTELEELPQNLLDWYASKCLQLFVENECNRVVKYSINEMVENCADVLFDSLHEANKTEGYM